MPELIAQTASVCPECLRRVPARLIGDGDRVVLDKTCPEHGPFAATVWRGEPSFRSWSRPKLPYRGGSRTAAGQGCPYDCGLCPEHGQRTCTALVEITSRCNLRCPVCFADSGSGGADPDPAALARMFAGIIDKTGGCNLQLSGGEPTMRPDLADIVRSAADAGFTFIQLNSNGLAFADDPDLAPRLHDAGLSSVFFQFDGLDDGVFTALRGRPLLAEKCRALDNIARSGLGVVLVPTIVRGINAHQLGDLVRFGLNRAPTVRGVHFQPISYFGRYPRSFVPDHVTLPELMRGLAEQSWGALKIDDFRPPGCEHALCSFSARYLHREDGSLQRLGGTACDCSPKPAEEGARTAIGITARQWGPVIREPVPMEACLPGTLDHFLQLAKSRSFQVSAMAFQDAWSLNLERLQGCCIHVARPDGRLIPFCSFNLTARDGRPLHRPRNGMKMTPVDALTAGRLGLPPAFTREDLEHAQLAALRRTLRHATGNSPFYRVHLRGYVELHSLADLAQLPLLTAEDIVREGQRLLCVSQSRVSRVVTLQTSGSTGAAKRLFFTEADLAATTDFFLHGMRTMVDMADRVLVLLPFQQPDSVGDLLIRALADGGIEARGIWPPGEAAETAAVVREQGMTCAVGLPQHLLALAYAVGPGFLKSTLLCSDYAAPALRSRIEEAAGCETFLHYGATESGLGGAVDCGAHCGCHIRESELLVEIVDPETGRPVPDGVSGEVVITTIGREAMPLIRYRTGDTGVLDRSRCLCGGVTARLRGIRGRQGKTRLPDGQRIGSQDLDDLLYRLPGLLDYRLTIDASCRIGIDFLAVPGHDDLAGTIIRQLASAGAIRDNLASGGLTIGEIRQVKSFAPTHTVKRTIQDLRTLG